MVAFCAKYKKTWLRRIFNYVEDYFKFNYIFHTMNTIKNFDLDAQLHKEEPHKFKICLNCFILICEIEKKYIKWTT